MKKAHVEVAIVAISALLLIVLAYERGNHQKPPPQSVFSTYDTGPNGYRALYEVLHAAGVPVGRFERELGTLDSSVRTLVMTGYEDDLSSKPLDTHDTAVLRRFVVNGGRLIAIDEEFAGPQDVTPGVGTTLRNGGGDAVALAHNAYTSGVARVGGSIRWIFPFREPRGVPLLANKEGMVAVTYRFGRGEVVAITTPELFSNAQLRDADNLRFAYNVIANHGASAFDEYVHGYSENPTMWGVLPAPVHAAVWVVAALAIVGLIGANVPFAPPCLAERSDERDSSDYITAIAELMRRSRHRPRDADVVREARAAFCHPERRREARQSKG